MASSINAITSGPGGVATTADASGILNIQTGGTTAISIDASQNVTFTNSANLPNTFGFKNRIINGAMMIDQRNAGASVTINSGNAYTLDRWYGFCGGVSGKFSVQQNAGAVTPPAGFTKYLGMTSLSAYSIGVSERFGIQHNIEGLNVADLGWGTANAQSITFGFWARSSLTGTFGGSLSNNAGNRCYVFSYTINSANTWEYKIVTVAGDTSGTWLTDNSTGITLIFSIASGSSVNGTAGSWGSTFYYSVTGQTSVVGTNGATFYITGVQLEKGSTATSFDYRPYGTELQLCQRYYYRSNCVVNKSIATLQAYAATQVFGKLLDLPVTMRATPTASLSSVNHFFPTNTAGAGTQSFSSMTLTDTTTDRIALAGSGGTTGLVAGNATVLECNTSSAWLDASAEL